MTHAVWFPASPGLFPTSANVRDDQFVDDAAAGPDHGLAVAPHIPGETDSRSEVVAIGIVEAWDVNPFLDESLVRIKAAEDVVAIVNNAAELVAHAEFSVSLGRMRQSSWRKAEYTIRRMCDSGLP
jgi:hypothetical protein